MMPERPSLAAEVSHSPLALVLAVAGCGGDMHVSAVDGSAGSSSATSTTGPSTSTDVQDVSSTGDQVDLLCTDGPAPRWCFERRDLLAGGSLLDFDRDGLADATSIQGDGGALPSLSGFRNIGDASLALAWEIELPFESPFYETVTDSTGVSRILVGSKNELDTPLVVFRVDESGADVEGEIPLAHDWTFGAYALLDTNRDELEDVVIIAGGAERMMVLLGTPDQGYVAQPEITLDEAVYGATGWAVGDVDGDGNVDLLTPRTGTASPSVYFGDGVGGFGEVVDVDADGRWPAFVVDIENDGRGDVLTPTAFGFAVAYSEPARTLRVVEQGRGDGPTYNTENFRFIPADLDRDGLVEIVGFQDDLVTVDENGANAHYIARLHVYSGLGNSGFATDRSVLFEESCDAGTEAFTPVGRAVELDGDGEPDFVFRWTTACPQDLTKANVALLFRPG